MMRAAAVLIYLPSPKGFTGTGESGKVTFGVISALGDEVEVLDGGGVEALDILRWMRVLERGRNNGRQRECDSRAGYTGLK